LRTFTSAKLYSAVAFLIVTAGCSSPGNHAVPAGAPNRSPESVSKPIIDPHVGEAPATYAVAPSRSATSVSRHTRDVTGILPAMTMNVLWDTLMSDGLHHLTVNTAPGRIHLHSLGQTWYINGSPVPGTQPVYTDGLYSDRMDSPTPNEGGYSEIALQGYAFSSNSQLGLSQYARYFKPGTAHGTLGAYGQTSGWNAEPLPFFGWARYNSGNVLSSTTTGGGIQAAINLAAGGTIWSWTWNGIQFVNTADYGREIQSDFFCYASSGCSQGWSSGQNPTTQNPNEAGDNASTSTDPDNLHGSPLASYSISANEIRTTTVPLEWNPSASPESPAIQPWQGYLYSGVTISKDVQFGYGGLPGVARYTTTFHVPTYLSSVAAELPTGYLQPNFNTYFIEDAGTNWLSAPMTIPNCPTGTFTHQSFYDHRPSSGYGGVIISTSDQNTAMGIYGRLTTVGGPIDHFELWDWAHNNCPSQTSKYSAVYYGPLNAGDNSFTTFIVTGSVSQVRQWMASLYAMGAA
jgi:hypothetical protein